MPWPPTATVAGADWGKCLPSPTTSVVRGTICTTMRNALSFEPLTVAAINATVLSVLVAGISVWAALRFGILHTLEEQAFQQAARVPLLPTRLLLATLGQRGTYEVETEEQRAQLAHRLQRIVIGVDDPDVPEDVAVRGQEALLILSHLLTAPPYHRLPIASVDDLSDWIGQVYAGPLAMAWHLLDGRYRRTLDVIVEAYAEAVQAREAPFVQALGPEAGGGAEGAIDTLRAIREQVARTQESADQVRLLLEQRRAYRARLPSKRLIVGALLLSSVVFGCGVVLPLFHSTPPEWLVAYVPGVFYLVVLLAAVAWVARS